MRRSGAVVMTVFLVGSMVAGASTVATSASAAPNEHLGGWVTEGNRNGVFYGWDTATAGDVNGDGFDDVVVGAFGASGDVVNEGKAFVYHGSPSGLSLTQAWAAEGGQEGSTFGGSVAGAGDVNGDGFGDVLVGAAYYSNDQVNEGRAFLYQGSAAGLSRSPSWTAESDQVLSRFGSTVVGAGDVNGDGYDDVLVGAEEYDDSFVDGGKAFLYLGSAAGLATTPAWTAEGDQSGALFGYSLAGAGDVNGDGYDDVIASAAYRDVGDVDDGAASLYLGSPTGLAPSPAWTVLGDRPQDYLGYRVAGAGDVNGDGFGDVVVSALGFDDGQTDEGAAFLYLGSAAGPSLTPDWTAEGDQVGACFGCALGRAGDVNADGYDDVVVGAWLFDDGQADTGQAFLYLGSASGLQQTPERSPGTNQAGAAFGRSVGTAGDVNGDGFDDVVVGAPLHDHHRINQGVAVAYPGRSGGLGVPSRAWVAAVP